jgi:hypothetical protein
MAPAPARWLCPMSLALFAQAPGDCISGWSREGTHWVYSLPVALLAQWLRYLGASCTDGGGSLIRWSISVARRCLLNSFGKLLGSDLRKQKTSPTGTPSPFIPVDSASPVPGRLKTPTRGRPSTVNSSRPIPTCHICLSPLHGPFCTCVYRTRLHMAVYWRHVCSHEADVRFGPYHTTFGSTTWMIVPRLCCSTGIMRDRNFSVSWACIASVRQNRLFVCVMDLAQKTLGSQPLTCVDESLCSCLRIWAPPTTLSRSSAPRGSPRSSCQTLSHCYTPPSLDISSPVDLTLRTLSTPPGVPYCYAVGTTRRRWLAEMSHMLPLCQVLLSDVFG